METPRQPSEDRREQRRFKAARLLVPLIFAVVVVSILSKEIPALRDAREQLFNPTEHRARKACHAAALAAAEQPTYARILDDGEVHRTQGALYVEGVRVGEMGLAGGEVTFAFTCYVDADGKIVRTQKQKAAASTKPDSGSQRAGS